MKKSNYSSNISLQCVTCGADFPIPNYCPSKISAYISIIMEMHLIK